MPNSFEICHTSFFIITPHFQTPQVAHPTFKKTNAKHHREDELHVPHKDNGDDYDDSVIHPRKVLLRTYLDRMLSYHINVDAKEK